MASPNEICQGNAFSENIVSANTVLDPAITSRGCPKRSRVAYAACIIGVKIDPEIIMSEFTIGKNISILVGPVNPSLPSLCRTVAAVLDDPFLIPTEVKCTCSKTGGHVKVW